jgi:phosphoglycolate phosphatase
MRRPDRVPRDLTVLFDLDGTLTDSRAGITGSIRHAMACMGRDCPDDDALAAYIGPPLRGTFTTLLETADPEIIETAVRHYRARYDDVGLFENTVYDGVPEMLEAAARWAGTLRVVTAKQQHVATRILAHFGLARYFQGIHGAEPGGRFDHKAELIGHLIERGAIRAESAVMVGDRHLDMQAARAHRVRAIGALWGFGDRRELTEAGADLLCEHPRGLAACLAPTGR